MKERDIRKDKPEGWGKYGKELGLAYSSQEEYDKMLAKVKAWHAETDMLLDIRLGQEMLHKERLLVR